MSNSGRIRKKEGSTQKRGGNIQQLTRNENRHSISIDRIITDRIIDGPNGIHQEIILSEIILSEIILSLLQLEQG